MTLILSQDDIRPLLDSDSALYDAIDAVTASLTRSHRGDLGQVVFSGLGLSNGDELTTYFTSRGSGDASLRLFPRQVNGPRNDAALGLRIDGNTSAVSAIIALDDANVLRTAIPAAVGVKYLAPASASTLAVLGSGSQAAAHLRAITRVMPDLKTVRVWSPTRAHREAFCERFRSSMTFDVLAADSAEEAVADADVITAAGRYEHTQNALESAGWVRPGALFVSITVGSGANLVAAGAQPVVPTSQRPEVVAIGFSSGFMSGTLPTPPTPPRELGDVMTGSAAARDTREQTLVFQLPAPYLWDVPIFDWIIDWANQRGAGTTFDFSSRSNG